MSPTRTTSLVVCVDNAIYVCHSSGGSINDTTSWGYQGWFSGCEGAKDALVKAHVIQRL